MSLWAVSTMRYLITIDRYQFIAFFGVSQGAAEYDALTEDKIVADLSSAVGDTRNLDDAIIHLFSSNDSSN